MNQNLLNSRKTLLLLTFSVGFSGLFYSQAIIRDTLFFTGSEQNFIVPCGVTNLTIDAFGAKGANGPNNSSSATGGIGGLGGHTQGNVTVSSGQTFNVFVGGQATNNIGGFNGGGIGGGVNSAGGGGATDIRFGGNATSNRILVAGGGGGGGTAGCESSNVNGGNGGWGGGGNGQIGNDAPHEGDFSGGGNGGNGINGGVNGVGCNGYLGLPGSNAVGSIGGSGGGAPNCCCFSLPIIPNGGGGGGGFDGGGGGGGGSAGTVLCSGNEKGAGGGGAGGTNYVDLSLTNPLMINGVNAENGYVVFSYTSPIPTTPTFTTSSPSICSGVNIAFEVAIDPLATSYTWSVTGDLTIVSGQGTDSVTVVGVGNNGTISVTSSSACNVSVASTPIIVEINQNPVLAIVPVDFSVCPEDSVTLEATGADTYTWTGGIVNATSFIPTATQTYTVTGQNTTTSCSSELSQTVTLNPVPTAGITSNIPSPFCAGANVTLTGTPAGGTFSATSGDANALNGNIFNGNSVGTWIIQYTVTNTQGCSDSTIINLTTNCTIGLSQLSLEGVLNVYPNPTNGQFKITSELKEAGELQLFNQAGQLVYKKSLENLKENTIDIKNLAPGFYNLQINSGSKQYSGKLNVIK